jgi:hypothetical protein
MPRPKKDPKDKYPSPSVTMPPEVLKKLKADAKKRGMTVSGVIVEALRKWWDE